MNKPWRVGIVGAGGVVETLHLPVLSALRDDVKVVWICDKRTDRAAQVADRFKGIEACAGPESAPDVDIVLLAIPVGTRKAAFDTALERGWHVFCEKPFATSLAYHDEILARARKRGVQVGVGLMRRFYDSTAIAARLVRAGAFGPVVEAFAGEGGRARGTGRGEGWYQSDVKESGGGVLIETGSHLIDQVFHILGASGHKLRRFGVVATEGLDHHAEADISLSIGQQGAVDVRFAISCIEDVPNGIWIRSQTATIFLGTAAGSRVSILDKQGHEIAVLANGTGAQLPLQAFILEWRAFLEQCRSGVASIATADTARLSTALIEECYAQPIGERSAQASIRS